MINHTKKNCRAHDIIIAGPTGLACANCGAEKAESEVTLSRWEKTEKGRPVPQLKS